MYMVEYMVEYRIISGLDLAAGEITVEAWTIRCTKTESWLPE